jgi:hypothetical protein
MGNNNISHPSQITPGKLVDGGAMLPRIPPTDLATLPKYDDPLNHRKLEFDIEIPTMKLDTDCPKNQT